MGTYKLGFACILVSNTESKSTLYVDVCDKVLIVLVHILIHMK